MQGSRAILHRDRSTKQAIFGTKLRHGPATLLYGPAKLCDVRANTSKRAAKLFHGTAKLRNIPAKHFHGAAKNFHGPARLFHGATKHLHGAAKLRSIAAKFLHGPAKHFHAPAKLRNLTVKQNVHALVYFRAFVKPEGPNRSCPKDKRRKMQPGAFHSNDGAVICNDLNAPATLALRRPVRP